MRPLPRRERTHGASIEQSPGLCLTMARFFRPRPIVLGVPGRTGATHVVPFRMVAREQVFQVREQVGEVAEQDCVAASRHGKRFAELYHNSLHLAAVRPLRNALVDRLGEKKVCGAAGVKPASVRTATTSTLRC